VKVINGEEREQEWTAGRGWEKGDGGVNRGRSSGNLSLFWRIIMEARIGARHAWWAVACIGVLAVVVPAAPVLADATVTVDPGHPWLGFMNVFEIPQNGGAYVFGSPWGTADLRATFSGPVLGLSPNTVNDPDPFWYTPSGQPGATGNKIMDANMYVETTGVYTGETLTFTGLVLSDTLLASQDANGNGWTSVAFIKDFAPDYSSFNIVTAPMVNGVFSISLATINDPARHVQFGFETIGPNVWHTDVEPYGSIQVVPEPVSLAILGLGALALVRRRRSA
jgi:hypothetical protein